MSTITVSIEAGRHNRRDCPVEFHMAEERMHGSWRLVAEDDSRLNLEVDARGQARCVVPFLGAGQTHHYKIEPVLTDADAEGVNILDSGGSLDITIDGDLLTRYVYASVPARPYFYPVLAPGQVPVTRAYPMTPDADGETRDHPHHRSMWIAHGEVNEADNWSEAPGHACTRHVALEQLAGSFVSGDFSSRSLWTRSDGATILTQHLHVRAWASGAQVRVLDFDIALEASHGDVHFGDTKEGGILSIRVASEIDVPRTGRITNVYGGIDEAETWGKSAHWCDYSGLVAGSHVGIAVFDHPHSFRYPTHWHVRNYGLMTANPFAYSAYSGGVKEGSHHLKNGDTLSFRYRILLHRHDCATADVAGHYLNFVAPPNVTVSG